MGRIAVTRQVDRVVTVLLLGVAAGCGGGERVQRIPVEDTLHLSGAPYGSGADDLWLHGAGVFVRWDGAAWRDVPVPAELGAVTPVRGVPDETDALWVTNGARFIALRADGTYDDLAELPMASTVPFVQVVASEDGAYAHAHDLGTGEMGLWAWSEGAFVEIPLPSVPAEESPQYTLLRGRGPGLWATLSRFGSVASTMHWDGSAWTEFTTVAAVSVAPVQLEGRAVRLSLGAVHDNYAQMFLHHTGSLDWFAAGTASTAEYALPAEYQDFEDWNISYRTLDVFETADGELALLGIEEEVIRSDSLDPRMINSIVLHRWDGDGPGGREYLVRRRHCSVCVDFTGFQPKGVLDDGSFVVGIGATDNDPDPSELYVGRP